MSEALIDMAWIIGPLAVTLLFPFMSWALGRWYQNRIMNVLLEKEKLEGASLQNENHLSTASTTALMSAQASALLHVSICVGPSIGQIFFMWFKSLFGGRLQSYDFVLEYGRREVLLRLREQAKSLGCTSIHNVRLETSVISSARNQDSKRASVEFLAFATGLIH
jgi:uncharacterized protein YbjQ (UPF0145 family)